MENKPIISVVAYSVQPEYRERYLKWQYETILPLLLKSPHPRGADTYSILKASPQYNLTMSILRFESMKGLQNFREGPEFAAAMKDMETTWTGRGGRAIWSALYELTENFTNIRVPYREPKADVPEAANVVHLEGYTLPPEEDERYNAWFAKWGREVYVPLLLKLPGLKEYAWYKFVRPGSPPFSLRSPVEYPTHLSIIGFENAEAYENYEKSLELGAFRAAVNTLIPSGLDYKWYVQYQLVRSWRK